VFKNEVENQLGKTIKALRSDQGGEYIRQEFKDYLKAFGIVQQLSPPYTPQHNGVSKRRNRTLLDMLRSMMNLTTFPLSFWDYALEAAAYILNMVWGCEALVKRDTPNKLQQRSVKCIFIGYPKETMGYYFYFPPKNKIVVARFAEFFEKNLLSQEVEGSEPPQEEEAPIRRSYRPHRALNRLCLNVEVEEHSLRDLNEPANYKAAMLDPESNKWLDAMNAKMQSMKDNQVWRFVNLPPNGKTVGSKWLFKKKMDMDSNVHTYKARLVGQRDLLKPTRLIMKKRSHPFLALELRKCFAMKDLGVAAFILGIKIHKDRSRRLTGLCQSAYIDKILKRYKMDNSERGYIPMQERLDLNKMEGASTPGEVKHIQNIPYALAVGSIMYAVRCTRPDIAFAQNITSHFQQNPSELHWTAVKTILKYLRNTKDMFLVYGRNPEA
nr:hypothetical protein [Tanacetum cinerariifolium]